MRNRHQSFGDESQTQVLCDLRQSARDTQTNHQLQRSHCLHLDIGAVHGQHH